MALQNANNTDTQLPKRKINDLHMTLCLFLAKFREQARQDFSRKLKWGPSDFSGEKFSWRLLPSAARVRPAPAAAYNSPSVRCAPLACANDLTPCRDGLAF
jgi:hypothetical protein